MSLASVLDDVARDLRAAADPEEATGMSAYMKNQFPFLGVKTPTRRAIQKPLIEASAGADAGELLDVARRCWDEEQREFQYVGADLLRKRAGILEPGDLHAVEALITTKSWWDTVDSLAAWTVGPMVRHHPLLADIMDGWIDGERWVARTAILHQLSFKHDTDEQRLFDYCRRRAGDTDFFIRKAIGWAMRQYARVAPDDVRAFVEAHDSVLSSLSKREALKHLGPTPAERSSP
jgi:3-methyladenine DNA glycosylase AlkD